MTHTLMIAIVMIACIAAIVAALVFISRKDSRKKAKALEDGLTIIANDKQLNPDKKEMFRNRLVAMDTKKEVLVYVQLKNDKVEGDLVDIRQMNSCEVMKISSNLAEANIKDQKAMRDPISKVHLQFKGAGNLVFNIVFYSETEDGAAEMQLHTQKAIAWRDIIVSFKKTAVLA